MNTAGRDWEAVDKKKRKKPPAKAVRSLIAVELLAFAAVSIRAHASRACFCRLTASLLSVTKDPSGRRGSLLLVTRTAGASRAEAEAGAVAGELIAGQTLTAAAVVVEVRIVTVVALRVPRRLCAPTDCAA
jgi:hypothetical protein